MPLDPDDLDLLDYLRDGATSTDEQVLQSPLGRWLLEGARARTRLTDVERSLLPTNRRWTADDVREAKSRAVWWSDYGFSPDEIRTWLAAGAQPWEASLVAELIGEGFAPGDLSRQISHMTTGELVTPLDVARQLPAQRAYFHGKTLCDLLDEAGFERIRGTRPLTRHERDRAARRKRPSA